MYMNFMYFIFFTSLEKVHFSRYVMVVLKECLVILMNFYKIFKVKIVIIVHLFYKYYMVSLLFQIWLLGRK